MSLTGKVVIVTGGAGLLGQAFCSVLAAEGAVAVLADIDEERAIGVKGQILATQPGAKVEVFKLDINSQTSIDQLVQSLDQAYGRIDALVNNAYPRNANYGREFFSVEYSDFCENVELNLGGQFLMSQRLARYFLRQGRGNIVNIASIYGFCPPRFEIYNGTKMTVPIEYAVVKSALIHLTRYMAKILAGSNIRVNAISPGGLFNDQDSVFVANYNQRCLSKGLLSPKDVTGTLVYLLSDTSQFVNGQNLVVDDGFTL